MGRQVIAAACFLILLGLGACGVKGPLEPPSDADPAVVHHPGAQLPPPPEGEAPDEPFVLDRLLM